MLLSVGLLKSFGNNMRQRLSVPTRYSLMLLGFAFPAFLLQIILLWLTPKAPRDLYLNTALIGALVGSVVGCFVFYTSRNYGFRTAFLCSLAPPYLLVIFFPIFLYIAMLCAVYG
ncbi:MAG: hypothetical protein A3F33_03230 [Candidatus Woykebacteria bacterium RIFCSPHIGHO2_12_FULL_43_10]|uniref:Uncharacterized protein n=2 Tax=Candidatus Woykeibacteriota TaxID=1817899 RepID=A0A1G1WWY3_9BACT|nr:MAG: hypothetical protein A2802_02495 [Candidatus Woykebacteria bacterium RIFCSPHIGHO2_01_FULL_43_29]OGY28918.1 MAG: hypothetical protein A3F33_03230 [Candidatus Woykebacteria bacterium RIFCSPHIGHO2_12_FULL_43_10]OGY29927.1 MAG: hypothetical protein A3J50_01805 [Candidatus Woykebacteria bacterium RIFCSPHIGHO2_02_FULL_43_16b]OGY32223.1 MAG: hypothetical protein A3A61_01800 [Candidatus Woykebacteria bacterium RIFCSPLOWO2_01_FULL_43_14]